MIDAPFFPVYGTNQVLTAAATSSAAVAIDPQGNNRQVRIVNTGANIAYVRIGPSTLPAATTADLAIPPASSVGNTVIVSKDPMHTHIRHISAAGSTLQVMLGEGF